MRQARYEAARKNKPRPFQHALGPQLAARGIRFVAISPDTPVEVADFARSRPGYAMRLLSDEKPWCAEICRDLHRASALLGNTSADMLRALDADATIRVRRFGSASAWLSRTYTPSH